MTTPSCFAPDVLLSHHIHDAPAAPRREAGATVGERRALRVMVTPRSAHLAPARCRRGAPPRPPQRQRRRASHRLAGKTWHGRYYCSQPSIGCHAPPCGVRQPPTTRPPAAREIRRPNPSSCNLGRSNIRGFENACCLRVSVGQHHQYLVVMSIRDGRDALHRRQRARDHGGQPGGAEPAAGEHELRHGRL
jgi:hypothetical protein